MVWQKKENNWEDPIAAEVRQVRDQYFKEMGYDLHRLLQDLKRQKRKGVKEGRKYVTLPPKRIGIHTGTND